MCLGSTTSQCDLALQHLVYTKYEITQRKQRAILFFSFCLLFTFIDFFCALFLSLSDGVIKRISYATYTLCIVYKRGVCVCQCVYIHHTDTKYITSQEDQKLIDPLKKKKKEKRSLFLIFLLCFPFGFLLAMVVTACGFIRHVNTTYVLNISHAAAAAAGILAKSALSRRYNNNVFFPCISGLNIE